MSETGTESAVTLSAAEVAALLIPRLARELSLPGQRVERTLKLFDEGATVPFVARYRKEQTGGMDEVVLRTLIERRDELVELESRRATILRTIGEQGKLTPELKARIEKADSRTELEDLYAPYKPKRRTRATIARERGLEPLARVIRAQAEGPDAAVPAIAARAHVDPAKEVPDLEAALQGARDIVAEELAEDALVRSAVRDAFAREGLLVSEPTGDFAPGGKKQGERTKFETYYGFREAVKTLPSHRYLAIRRGEREEVLRVGVEVNREPLVQSLEGLAGVRPRSPAAGELRAALADSFIRLLAPTVETDVRAELKQKADVDAVEVFASNIRDMLLAAPFGARPVLGVDPGIRTGCKLAMVDRTGKLLDHSQLFLESSAEQKARGAQKLKSDLEKHRPAAIAVGNGTYGREAFSFFREVCAEVTLDPKPVVVAVNESGASVYSASDVAREEFPDHDLTVRGAISIARRLQDPLAELVKIDPKAVGVGQYQHDVSQTLLKRKLGEVVESCVNFVGVDVNTASPQLLGYVAGIGPRLAKNIVTHRETEGPFTGRQGLLEVSGMGPKTFEQSAGFLRVRPEGEAAVKAAPRRKGWHPLDDSAVHPERYALVERMARDLGVELSQLVGHPEAVKRVEIGRYVEAEVGEPTLRDILAELGKPGRDPRAEFEPPAFREDVRTMDDLRPGMMLEGVVTNVTDFGAFVDIGVHQDGLVHVSELADRFIKNPREAVNAGQKLEVRVISVDLQRKRIALSARKQPRPEAGQARPERGAPPARDDRRGGPPERGGGPPNRGGGPPPRSGGPGGGGGGSGSGVGAFKNNPFAALGNKNPRRN